VRKDGGANESAPPVNLVQLRENGPLGIRADIKLDGVASGYRATLCRCGQCWFAEIWKSVPVPAGLLTVLPTPHCVAVVSRQTNPSAMAVTREWGSWLISRILLTIPCSCG
jgi:hypothetical protein